MSRYDRPVLAEPETLPLFDMQLYGNAYFRKMLGGSLEHLPVILTIQQAFEQFDRDNPWVAVELRRMALDLVRAGHERIGIGMLFEVLRWRYMRATTDASSSFKLNNNYRSRYARMLMESEPALDGVFETRRCSA